MSYNITLIPSEQIVEVQPGETILEAALRHGISLPYHCRMASCGTCAAELLEGDVTYGDVPVYALTEEEMAQGHVLLCSAQPLSDCLIKTTSH